MNKDKSTSRLSSKSRMSLSSSKSKKSMYSNYNNKEEVEVTKSVFVGMFGSKVYEFMNEKQVYIEKMGFHEFEHLTWDYNFPYLVLDLVEYVTGFDLKDYIQTKRSEEEEEK